MIASWNQIAEQIRAWGQASEAQRAALCATLDRAAPTTLRERAALLSATVEGLSIPHKNTSDSANALCAALVSCLARGRRAATGETASEAETHSFAQAVAEVAAAYTARGEKDSRRFELLRLLAATGGRLALTQFAALMVTDPPTDAQQVALAFSPLFRFGAQPVEALFPKLWEAIPQESVIPVALDLANYLTEQGVFREHPARQRVGPLAELFAALIERLRRVEEQPDSVGQTLEERKAIVARSISLAVALAHTLALSGDRSITPKLRRAMEVRHRGLRAEAAAALARLDDEVGVITLVGLAADPATRSRALRYLEEFHQLEQVAEEYRSPAARALGELSAWLAQPTQFGVAPTEMELVDERELAWPGYSAPVACYLIRYRYVLPGGTWDGVGVAGPVVFSFRAELAGYSPAELYAMYCGWSVESEQFVEVYPSDLTEEDRAYAASLSPKLQAAGYQTPTLEKLLNFFGQRWWVWSAQREGAAGVVFYNGATHDWTPIRPARRPLGPTEITYLFFGRRLLRKFNPDF